MYLTKEEELMFDGEWGPAVQRAMKILVAIGDIYEADKLTKVRSVHISGPSYKSAEEAGLNLVKRFAEEGASFRVANTTLNPIGMDVKQWKEMNTPEEFAEKQMRILRGYQKMGAMATYTCTPYFIGNVPRSREDIAWSESNAIIFANSVLGARTNRESNPSTIAASIVGKTPRCGYHLEKNRHGNVVVNIEAELEGTHDYMALGYYVGAQFETGAPVFRNIPKDVSLDKLKCLGAALATSGGVAIFHVVGVTPEAKTLEEALGGYTPLDKISVGYRELQEVYEKLSTSEDEKIDYVMFGCPHASLEELKYFSDILKGKKIHDDVELWICTSAAAKAFADRMGFTEIIGKAGARLVCDTCSATAPVKEIGFKTMATNSAKAAHYNIILDDFNTFFGSAEDCVEAAVKGRWRK